MAIKPFAIQGADLTLGGVNLQAGATTIVIPGVTQATNYFAEEVNEQDGSNPDIFGGDEGAVTVIDNSRYLQLTGTAPSGSYVAATYSVDELDDGQIESINVESDGVFAAADKTRVEAGNMWATLTPTPFASFNSANWTQIPFRPKMRAGVVENVSGGGTQLPSQSGQTGKFLKTDGEELSWATPAAGNANTGNFTFKADRITNDDDASIVVGDGSPVENVVVNAVDQLVPPGGVWRMFFLDADYLDLGTTVQVGDTVTTSWGTPITATITDIVQDIEVGTWALHFDQDITAGFDNGNTVTFNRGLEVLLIPTSKTWTFGQDGSVTLPNGMSIESYGALGVNASLDIGGDDTRIRIDDNGAPPGFSITTNATGGMASRTWLFGPDGNISFPDGSTQTTAYTGQVGGGTTVSYKGFKAVYARMYIDEPTISKVLIYQDTVTTTPTLEVDTDTSRDLFKVSGLANSSFIALVNIFGSDDTYPTSLSTLQHFAKSIIDNVILDNGDENTNIDTYNIKSRFYDNFDTFASRAGNRYKNFEFLREEWFNISGTGGAGTGASFDLYRDVHSDLIDNVNTNQGGINYQVGNVITISGASLGGTTPANNVVITVTGVGEAGQIQNYDYTGILPANTFPLDNIDDGGDDQYDGANYIFTNIQGDSYIAYHDDESVASEGAWAVNYNGGDVNESGAAWFGAGSEYVVTYNDSIFGLFVTGANINWIATNGNSGFDGDGRADTGSLDMVDTDGLINGNQTFVLNADGSVKFPDGSIQTTAYTEGDPNVWVQDFESTTIGVPTDTVASANSVEYLNNGDIVAVFQHYYEEGSGTYNTIGRFTPTGEKVWSMKFQGNVYTSGWGLAVDNAGNYIFLAGESSGNTGYSSAVLTKLAQADGAIIWSKTYDVGYNNSNVVVDMAGDDPIVVGYADNGTDNQIVTTKIHGGTGEVLWSKALDGQGDDEAYGMAVDNSNGGDIVTVGYIAEIEVAASHSVTPLTGSTTDVLVINRSDLAGDQLTDTWLVSGTGITGTAGISEINAYTNLTGTVREGSGATFDFVIAGDGSITNPVTVATGGINYLVGHKIKIPYTSIGGADANSDIILTVTGATDGAITSVAAGYFGGGAGSPNNYYSFFGTNYQTGSGLTFQFLGSGAGDYTGQDTFISSAGTNYVLDDVVTISGALLGGTSPENDMTVTVNADLGAVVGFMTFTGTQQTATYRIIVPASSVDFGGVGTWTLSGTTLDQDDRMVVVKYDSNGAIVWQRAVQVEAGYNCTGADAAIDSDGNIYVCGNFDYDNGGTNQAMILIKFNSSGTKKWTRKVQGPCEDYASSVVVGPDNCLYLSAFTASADNNDYSMVIAKYNLDGTVAWQRLLDSLTNWTFAGQFFFGNGGGSTIAVRDGYVAVVGGVANFNVYTAPRAIIAQFSTDGKIFTRGDYDFKAATFSGLLNTTASNITVADAGKVSSNYDEEFTISNFTPDFDLTSNLVGTVYRSINAGNELVNGNYTASLNANGSLTLPAGGTVSEGYVTSNPTIQLTPARPDVASQKLVIKGGGLPYALENGIEVSVNETTRTVGQTLTVTVYSEIYGNQTLYWWINPEGVGISDPESGTVTLTGNNRTFSILIDSDDYEFRVRVSPEDHNYGPEVIGAQSPLINSSAPTFNYEHHLHLTTGNLAETSIFLGTDNHNVRTTTDGGIEITTETTTINPPDTITITGADVTGVNLVYTRDPAESTPTWKSPVVNPATDPYIEYEYGMGFGIFAPDIDPVTPIYVNAGTLAKPFTHWSLNPPYGSVAPTGVYTYIALDVHTWQFGIDGTTIFPTLTVERGDDPSNTITGQTLLFGDSTQEAIISTPNGTVANNSSQRLVINPGEGYNGGEGGDIYLWAGRGGAASGTGGDIKIRGGQGGANTDGGAGGDGGYIRIEAGDAASTGGDAGYVDIHGGLSTTSGGAVNIRTATTNTFNHAWQFGNNGTLTLPKASKVSEVTPATGPAPSIYPTPGVSSIPNEDFVTTPPPAVNNYTIPGTDIVINMTFGTNGPNFYGPTATIVNGGTGHTTGESLMIPYADMGITYGGNWEWFINAIASNLVLEAGTKDWTFGADGKLTLPDAGIVRVGVDTAQVGSSIVIATGSAYGDTAVSIASNTSLVSTYLPGGTITFQDGEVRTITQIDDYPGGTDVFWNTAKTGTLFPIILKTANYVAATLASEWEFGTDGTLTFPDATVQTTALVQGEQTFIIDYGNTDYAPTAVDFNLLFVTPAIGYSDLTPTSVTLPNGVPGQRLVIFNGYNLAILTVNPGPVGRDISSGVVAEFIYSGFDGLWMPLYGTNSPT